MLTSCASTSNTVSRPDARQLPTQVSLIDFYGTELKFAWTFTNSLASEIRLLSYVWELHVDGKRVQRAQSRQVRTLAPHSEITLELPVTVKRSELEKLLKTSPAPSGLPYEFIGKANLGAGIRLWPFDLSDKGTLNLLSPLSFGIRKFQIVNMDDSRANVNMEIQIDNPNSFATRLGNFTADLILSGQTVAQAMEGGDQEIAANGFAVIALDLNLNFRSLGRAVRHALAQDESPFTLYGKTEMSTPWGVKKVNYDRSGNVKIER